MPRVRINEGDLLSGAGVEGRRKRKHNEDPSTRKEQQEAVEKRSRQQGRPIFGNVESDIFYTKRVG
ncbi:MAG TPA: hypothetical protein PKK74_02040 [Candidatus Methanoculleus thermohydrogenotrophicum]|jgi:hypothetical protein|nr:hypothetical protein [Candidatus Methanoculleus thermohydrogenotrophicum]NLM83008.1 hypothetical protein [Candidatus Methanoculleus thermohydrogenotrophicum]HOB17465.1 hypothetical protein [Candidatus Methanoculleus thermohydrogenotrophicum]HPZ37547.1 hypothetical protein [Candidatus Methanoculleus thermohydrogenotrophicum]HQC90712.1 hypothetical protein [Candidatus Methanoculleus thermohydrogenotrophicum]